MNIITTLTVFHSHRRLPDNLEKINNPCLQNGHCRANWLHLVLLFSKQKKYYMGKNHFHLKLNRKRTNPASSLLGDTMCCTLLCWMFSFIILYASSLISLAITFFTPGISRAYRTERRPDAAKPSKIVIPLSTSGSEQIVPNKQKKWKWITPRNANQFPTPLSVGNWF